MITSSIIAASIAAAGGLGAAKINSNAMKNAPATPANTGGGKEKPGDSAWKAAAVQGLFSVGAAYLQARASGKAAAAGSAAEKAQLDFVREQWEERKKLDAAALIEEKARHTANEERMAPYRAVSAAIGKQQAERLGIKVPPERAKAEAKPKSPLIDYLGNQIPPSSKPLEYAEARTSPNAYSVVDPQTLSEIAKLKRLMEPEVNQGGGLTLADIMAFSKNPTAFGAGGAFGGMQ